MILTPNNFSKNLKVRVRYFLGHPLTYYVEKKRIARITARSIRAGLPHTNPGKMVPGENGPRKNGPRKDGPRETQKQKIVG